METIKGLWFEDGRIFIETAQGKVLSQSMKFFPRLSKANEVQRSEWSASPFGLHWEKLDEDISFESFTWSDNDPLTLYHQA
ncbi:MAG: DUF2442 domain-containing protein [Tannerella sp.]|jgi:hypothetical protein|nr:DUF2442 domain-containing protein [Tannerella sp.]